MIRLTYDFYNRHAVDVAKDLLGKTLYMGDFAGFITEVEAYRGYDDEASHAFKGQTSRNSVMFGKPGFSYIYMIYGIYYCLNIVTEEENSPSAVLIRGLISPKVNLDGPGKICRHLNINKNHNKIDLTSSNILYLTEGKDIKEYESTSRIGIKKAIDKQWRFLIPTKLNLINVEL